ncbi:AsnC family transcriptional regulator [Methanocella sp. CWC-04]|uniref:AsnC family transcriptional regulator n=1 Tax=Methanooceanicella nereidis TaxID=2052831 RepID=A0AAP2W7A0_9EURY|nr:Lrp/AsnC family transcriptional regulator [Methanocella sp. CWC-04]MCD1295004.1 AsnC family transcriptional regulator [Methanocella sp. CWC-04]
MTDIDLDDKDRKIIALFKNDPDISQIDIAEKVGLSQPSVGARVSKLKQSGILSTVIGMNFKKVGLSLAKVDITTKNSIDIINMFKECPYFLNGFIVSGQSNLCLFLIAENISTIEAIVDRHIRSDPSVMNVELGIVIAPVTDMVMPVKMHYEKSDSSPCGIDCASCQYFACDRCLGCPITDNYKGKFW